MSVLWTVVAYKKKAAQFKRSFCVAAILVILRENMGRSPCCSKVGLRRGPWSTEEDDLLSTFILQNGEGQWRSLPNNAGLLRCGKSCRLRWMNYLRPGIKRGNITQDEEDLIVRMHGLIGNRWSLIAGRLPGRTDNEIKNYWNTHLLKKLQVQTAGIGTKSHVDVPRKPDRTKQESPLYPDDDEPNKEKRRRKVGPKEADKWGEQKEKTKVKLYLPKPIRVSPAFSRTSSCDSLCSGGSSGAAEMASCVPYAPFFELEEGYGGGAEDFLGGGCILPLHHHHQQELFSGDVGALEQIIYDEYLQLLSS